LAPIADLRAVLPYGRQTIEDDDVAAVAAALRDDFLTTGPKVAEFERAFAAATGAADAVACNSGTAALHLAVLTQSIGPGDAAIVPKITFVATANVVRMTGAEVVFADVDADTGLVTAETLREAIGRAERKGLRARLALPVHLRGQVCDVPALAAAAQADGVTLIEDACHALGVRNIGATVHSTLACFSTHPVKLIATGEGGVITTADPVLASRMRRLRSHGICHEPTEYRNKALAFEDGEASPWYHEMTEVGWNYRIPDVLCALGLTQLRKLERFHRRRAEIAAFYDAALMPLAPALRPVPHSGPHGWHLYAVLIDFRALATTRGRVMKRLRAAGIASQVHYIPVHRQLYYVERYGEQNLPGAEAYYKRCLSLPLFPGMDESDMHRVVNALVEIVGGRGCRPS
jgi:UDP-4-amino-4,6-dideoxy-N-acetyl-beta-L-altrosamine transaminase